MENHSYDNMLGYMPAPIGTLNENKYCNEYEGNQYCTSPGANFTTWPDPGHDFQCMNSAIFGTDEYLPGNEMEETMSWFAYNQAVKKEGNPQDVMDCYTPD